MSFLMTITYKGDVVDAEIDAGGGVHAPARRDGHPDDWTPDESEAPELISVKIEGVEVIDELSERERTEIVRRLEESRNENYDEPDDREPDDDHNVDCGTDNQGRGRP